MYKLKNGAFKAPFQVFASFLYKLNVMLTAFFVEKRRIYAPLFAVFGRICADDNFHAFFYTQSAAVQRQMIV